MLGQDVSRESVKYRCDRVSEGGEELLCKSQYGVICTSGCEVVVQKEIQDHHKYKKHTLRTTFPSLKLYSYITLLQNVMIQTYNLSHKD